MHLFMKETDATFDHLSAALHHFKIASELGHQEWKLDENASEEVRTQADVLWDSGNTFFIITNLTQ